MVARELLDASVGPLRFCRFDRQTKQVVEIPSQRAEVFLRVEYSIQPEVDRMSAQRPSFVEICRGRLERWILHGIDFFLLLAAAFTSLGRLVD